MSKRKSKKYYLTRSNGDSDFEQDVDEDDDFVPSKKINKSNDKDKKKFESTNKGDKKSHNEKKKVEKEYIVDSQEDDKEVEKRDEKEKNEDVLKSKTKCKIESKNLTRYDGKSEQVRTTRSSVSLKTSTSNPLQYVKPVCTPNLGIKVGLSRKALVKHSLHPLLSKK